MSVQNSNNVVDNGVKPEEAAEVKKLPTVSLLIGEREVVVRDLPKDLQGAWATKHRGNFNANPAVNGWIFPRSSIQILRESIPDLVGGSSIYDPSSSVPVVFTTLTAKAPTKEKEKTQRADFAKLGLTWNPVKGHYEGPVSICTSALLNQLNK